jgi:hypothetical protein
MSKLFTDTLQDDPEVQTQIEKPGARRHRRHRVQSQRAARRQRRIAAENGLVVMPLGRYVKHHAMDCGNPGCPLCANPRRQGGSLTARLTLQELRQPSIEEELDVA